MNLTISKTQTKHLETQGVIKPGKLKVVYKMSVNDQQAIKKKAAAIKKAAKN